MAKKGIQKIEDWVRLSKADFHIHSNYSDGKPTVLEILEHVENQTDLDVIAISDHDTMKGALEAQELMKEKNYRFELILAEEISSLEGHILGLFLKEEIPADLPAKEVLTRIHHQGGLAVAVHPFEHTSWKSIDPKEPVMNGVGLKTLTKLRHYFDGIEILNATPTLSDENLRAALFNGTYLLQAETGGSDAHILDYIGNGYTLFEGETAADFRKAIVKHQTRAMYTHWTLLAFIKYFFFFLPEGFRLLFNTILHGRSEHPEDE